MVRLAGRGAPLVNAADMILVIDNYDSFTYNLVHYLQALGTEVDVIRNDAIDVDQALSLRPKALLLSPGPGAPDDAGLSLAFVEAAMKRGLPLLGVCLGHQAIGQAFGGTVTRAAQPMHGKTSPIHHDGTGLFARLPTPFEATRYHSLVVAESDLPAQLVVNARTADGTIMGLRHRDLPIHGVQFHPESIATEHGHALLANFLSLAGVPHRAKRST